MKTKKAIKVGVSPNVEGGETRIAMISKGAFKRLEKLQYQGGFLRYILDFYNDDVEVTKYETKSLKIWMRTNNLPV